MTLRYSFLCSLSQKLHDAVYLKVTRTGGSMHKQGHVFRPSELRGPYRDMISDLNMAEVNSPMACVINASKKLYPQGLHKSDHRKLIHELLRCEWVLMV